MGAGGRENRRGQEAEKWGSSAQSKADDREAPGIYPDRDRNRKDVGPAGSRLCQGTGMRAGIGVRKKGRSRRERGPQKQDESGRIMPTGTVGKAGLQDVSQRDDESGRIRGRKAGVKLDRWERAGKLIHDGTGGENQMDR